MSKPVLNVPNPHEDNPNMMLKLDGACYRCSCGCNVFTMFSSTYRCNGCQAEFEGTHKPKPPMELLKSDGVEVSDENQYSDDLDSLLEEITVFEPGTWENEYGPKDWYAVGGLDGIVAYFMNEVDAFRYRLDWINRILNP